MKLNEIKQVAPNTVNLNEGVIPVHLTMTLSQVIEAGKITNSVQKFTIAELASMFRNGGPYRWSRDLNPYGSESSSDTIKAVESLSDADAVELSSWLLEQLHAPEVFESNPYCNAALSTVEWVKWVLKRQD